MTQEAGDHIPGPSVMDVECPRSGEPWPGASDLWCRLRRLALLTPGDYRQAMADHVSNEQGGVWPYVMLPDAHDLPTCGAQALVGVAVTRAVRGDLLVPERL